jgi:hypothetical protein
MSLNENETQNPATVRDALWLWGHEADSHFGHTKIHSRMTPAEAATYMDIQNLLMVSFANKPVPPFTQNAIALSPLKKVIWSICENSSAGYEKDMAAVRAIAEKFPNIQGVIVDDSFSRKDIDNGVVLSPDNMSKIKKDLVVNGRQMDLWMVLYEYEMDKILADYLKECDVLTFWTWHSSNLKDLEKNFEETEKVASQCGCKLMLGCYMYDYGDGGNSKPLSVSLMKKQCEQALQWLRQKRIEGIIFLASCVCDMDLEAVEWTRKWIKEVGDEKLV